MNSIKNRLYTYIYNIYFRKNAYLQEKRKGKREENVSPGCHDRFFSKLLIRYRKKRLTFIFDIYIIYYIYKLGIRILWVTLPTRYGHPVKPIDKRREGRKPSPLSAYNTGIALLDSFLSCHIIISYTI